MILCTEFFSKHHNITTWIFELLEIFGFTIHEVSIMIRIRVLSCRSLMAYAPGSR